jgi:hypothetical protein
MSEPLNSPFVPGARVAITSGFSSDRDWREGRVAKAYKNGRFTLEGSDQQWRPQAPGGYREYWTANQTGEGWNHAHLWIWDATTDSKIRGAIAETKRRATLRAILRDLERLRAEHCTDEQVDAIVSAINAAKAQGPSP